MAGELLARIDTLPDSDLIEAASYYLTSETGIQSPAEIEEMLLEYGEDSGADMVAFEDIRSDLSHDRESLRQLLRFLLRSAAQGTAEQHQWVLAAVEGSGQKQVVTELLLVVALSTLATMMLIHKTGGKLKESRKLSVEEGPDGSFRISIQEETTYASSSTALGRLFDWLKALPAQKGV